MTSFNKNNPIYQHSCDISLYRCQSQVLHKRDKLRVTKTKRGHINQGRGIGGIKSVIKTAQ